MTGNLAHIALNFAAAALLTITLAGATGCERNSKKPVRQMTEEDLIELNRSRANRESELLDEYIAERSMEVSKTRTGIRYEIYHGGGVDTAITGRSVGVTYTAYLLDSTKVESTGDKPRYFRIGQDNVISGLHEAVTLLAKGDSARIIIPSYLAYGLTGDAPTVPPNAPILYDICLVDIR
ncbi:MAG: FKBP-type peptidyl-prolyl cis-trans isomerase [Flavobacteriales bacterium]|nr:FKBP-type peptidyl-prolyl cis-trans isomerase [Flavobacteriales bacterium]